jgi:hypothetical protein
MPTTPTKDLTKEIDSNTDIFHSTLAILLDYRGGSSGAFITTLLNMFVWPDAKFNSTLSLYNNSHSGLAHFNWDESGNKFSMLDRTNCPNVSMYIKPRVATTPIIFFSHCTPDWDRFFYRWPMGRAISITVRHLDLPEIAFNVYWKLHVESFDSRENTKWWQNLQADHPATLGKYSRPDQISNEDLKAYLAPEIIAADIPEHADTGKMKFSTEHKVLRLPYTEIVNSQDTILNLIQEHLELPIPEIAKTHYKNYVENQNKLISEKAPWLRQLNFGN